jgi:hypothetical protein
MEAAIVAFKQVHSGYAVPDSMPHLNKIRKRHAQVVQHYSGLFYIHVRAGIKFQFETIGSMWRHPSSLG